MQPIPRSNSDNRATHIVKEFKSDSSQYKYYQAVGEDYVISVVKDKNLPNMFKLNGIPSETTDIEATSGLEVNADGSNQWVQPL